MIAKSLAEGSRKGWEVNRRPLRVCGGSVYGYEDSREGRGDKIIVI